jgi:hypothetical protein
MDGPSCVRNFPGRLLEPGGCLVFEVHLRFALARMVSASLVQVNGSHRSFQPSMKVRMVDELGDGADVRPARPRGPTDAEVDMPASAAR